MAVIQISQIQVRRGFLEDLGQLGSGEFAWAVDKLRLFIGNGTINDGAPYEGNTEILTTNSDLKAILGVYTYEGSLGGYVVQTGPDLANRITRPFQDKVDDIINIRDFGAKGNGFDDDTPALQRALFEIYGRRSLTPAPQTRRTIDFHPGVYLIGDSLLFPPFTSLRNSSKDSVVIRLVGTVGTSVFRVTDGAGGHYATQVPSATSLSYIGSISCTGIRFESSLTGTSVGIIDSSKGVYFNRCQFNGPVVASSVDSSTGISISSELSPTNNVHFIECDFNRFGKALDITSNIGAVSDIVVDRCTISNSFKGVIATAGTNKIDSVRVTNSVFASIAREALVTNANVSRVTSAFNTYTLIGKTYSPSAPAVSHVIDFGGSLCYSIADMIDRSPTDELYYDSVMHRNDTSVSTHSAGHFRFGNTYQTIGKSIILLNLSTNLIPLNTKYKSGIIDYSIERAASFRVGTVKFSFNSATQKFDFHDSYTETDNVGVDLTIEYNNSSGSLKPYIICIVADLASSAIITFDIKSQHQ